MSLYRPVTEFATRAEYWNWTLRCHGEWAPDKLTAAVAWLVEEEKKPASESRACVWHAAAVVYNRLDKCNCMPCTKERAAKAG